MNKVLLYLLLALFLGSCAKSTPAPDPKPAETPLIVGKWTLATEESVTVYKDGRPTVTQSFVTPPGSVTVTYTADGKVVSTTNGQLQESTYSPIQVGVATIETGTGYKRTLTVTVLTATQLVVVRVVETDYEVLTGTFTYVR